jgi:hypothetical protein
MRTTNSWQFSWNDSQPLHLALYVRAAGRLPVVTAHDVPPPLAYPQPTEGLGREDPAAALLDQWTVWWRRLVEHERDAARTRDATETTETTETKDRENGLRALTARRQRVLDPPDFASLHDAPELRSLVRRTFPTAITWINADRLIPTSAGLDDGPFPWSLTASVVEEVAEAQGVPAHSLRATAQILAVGGLWHHIPAPGLILCSRAAATDPGAARAILRKAFTSAPGA